ncbi:carboxypeptidase regulatory-like domain-containing protein [Candidatus Dojkabacteria bacterium]|uniref:Carboxypeptidase regulatory-like domain-containing protein n=1 Tax=Candidatus Dojkabacteria bacterium TaxID=2099670 RepID=A0A955L4M7_9BACT|nr:carboxypeptidase regulatory-like domain-containing protein [Candidatus Dojkabacteria bacterium]
MDQNIVKTNLEGYVRDTEGRPVTDAKIILQEKEVTSNSDGYYQIDGLLFGNFDIQISKNGYHTYEESISLKRFSNSMDFELDLQEFGEMKIYLKLPEDSAFFSEEFAIAINDQLLDVEGDLSVDTGKLLTGSYLLTIVSPFYETYSETIQVDPGYQELTINLKPASELLGQVTDWLSGKPVEPDRVEINTEGKFVELRSDYIDGNRIILENLNASNSIILRIFKDGYHTLDFNVDLELGLNNIGTIAMVPEGRVPLLEYLDGNSLLQVANYDGTELKTIHTVAGNCTLFMSDSRYAAYRCKDVYYLIDYMNEYLTSSIGADSDEYSYDMFSASIFEVYPNAIDKVVQRTLTGTKVIYSENETVTSVGASKSSTLVFTASNSVWSISKDAEGLKKVSDGIFTVGDLNRAGTKVLLYNQVGDKNNIWYLDLVSGEKSKLTQAASTYTSVRFINSEEFVYLDGTNLYKQSVNSDTPTKLREGVTVVTPIFDSTLLHLLVNERQALFNLETGKMVLTPKR